MKYNGNDIFRPFNAGLYGIDDDIDRALLHEESKENIKSEFEHAYGAEIKSALHDAGLKFIALEYWSPRFYNYETDSLDLEIEVENETKLLAALEKHRAQIEKLMRENKSYDGYMALTANYRRDIYKDGKLDILAVQAILSHIQFGEDDLYEWLVYDYACEKCDLIHSQIEWYSDEQKEKITKCEAESITK